MFVVTNKNHMKNFFYDKAKDSKKFRLSIEITLQVIVVRLYSLMYVWVLEAVVRRYSVTKSCYPAQQISIFKLIYGRVKLDFTQHFLRKKLLC